MVKELFVYGTLMEQTQSAMARFLHEQSALLGSASVRGRLYDLGSYPGAVYDAGETRLIYGQLYTVDQPESVFPVLDRYEGVSSDPKHPGEYIRALVPAILGEENREVNCWIYLYNLDTQSLPMIDSGNYISYFSHQPNHRRFIQRGR